MEDEKKIQAIKKIILFLNITGIISLICLITFLICFPLFIWMDYLKVFKIMGTSVLVYFIFVFFNKSLAIVKKQLEKTININN
jgi:hypothetical protein